MEKLIFLAEVRDRLTEMNLPQETVNKHIKIFENCFKEKSADEIDKVIEGAGGIDGMIKSIFDLENAKKNNEFVKTQSAPISSEESAEILLPEQKDDTNQTDFVNFHEPRNNDSSSDKKINESGNSTDLPAKELTDDDNNNTPTIEIDTLPELNEHIRDAEKMTETIERLTVTSDNNLDSVEYADELSDYDFEKLFAERLSLPEKWVETIRQKLSSKTYKATLPLAILIDIVLFVFVAALFPLLIISAVVFALVYVCALVSGVAFAIIPIGFSVYMFFKNIPIAMYELSIGVISTGVTMLLCILLYNYVKRLVPFLFKQLKILFKLVVKITKRYFGKTQKEEN